MIILYLLVKKLAKEIPETGDPPTANLNELPSDIRFRFKYVTKSKVFFIDYKTQKW